MKALLFVLIFPFTLLEEIPPIPLFSTTSTCNNARKEIILNETKPIKDNVGSDDIERSDSILPIRAYTLGYYTVVELNDEVEILAINIYNMNTKKLSASNSFFNTTAGQIYINEGTSATYKVEILVSGGIFEGEYTF